MFYENYELLCQKIGKKPYTVAREIGLGNSNVAQWKKGSTPRPEILQKIADYFGVSQAVLLGFITDQKEKSPTPEGMEQIPGYEDLSEENKVKARDFIAFLLSQQ